jgi:hypothetical protein
MCAFIGSQAQRCASEVTFSFPHAHEPNAQARGYCSYDTLIHAPYLNTLPSPSQLRTTLHFTEAELDALRGTNLYGATLERRQVWEAEWEQCRADISAVDTEWGKEFTWCVPFLGFIIRFCVCAYGC